MKEMDSSGIQLFSQFHERGDFAHILQHEAHVDADFGKAQTPCVSLTHQILDIADKLVEIVVSDFLIGIGGCGINGKIDEMNI
jgi:hypothetical protein